MMKITNKEYTTMCANGRDWIAVNGESDKDFISKEIWRIVNEKLGIG